MRFRFRFRETIRLRTGSKVQNISTRHPVPFSEDAGWVQQSRGTAHGGDVQKILSRSQASFPQNALDRMAGLSMSATLNTVSRFNYTLCSCHNTEPKSSTRPSLCSLSAHSARSSWAAFFWSLRPPLSCPSTSNRTLCTPIPHTFW